MQSRMAELQRELATRRYEASAGGGMVKAVASGELRIVAVEIEPGLLSSGDREMVQDLCAAAVNAALANAQRAVQEEFQRLSGGMALPNMMPPGGAG
ncbi:MAG: YbaB/EbfC family nucleoid-associated protein [Deltaproteobacteria bacterium]|nr:YbaB/EbfC family nucleoid-associated protein [Deltaproteobacteria bacterium]MBW2417525.1 YbaB/EbfC family nucleoid-associated protein [Deltaproteobacteria bacterium]